MGVNVNRIIAWTFVLGSALAAAAAGLEAVPEALTAVARDSRAAVDLQACREGAADPGAVVVVEEPVVVEEAEAVGPDTSKDRLSALDESVRAARGQCRDCR